MKRLENKYDEYGYANYHYRELIDSFELPVLLEAHDDNWQGDSFYLLFDPVSNSFGILIFGWGSCSGCDALDACRSYAEVVELRDELFNRILWVGSCSHLKAYVETKDWETEFYYNSFSGGGGVEFVEKLRTFVA